MAWLQALTTLVKGITLNTNLYTNKEERSDAESDDEMLPKQAISESEDEDEASVGGYIDEDDSYSNGRYKRKPATNYNNFFRN